MNIANKVLCVGLKTTCLGTSLTDKEVTNEVLANHNAIKGAMRVTKTRLKDAIDPFRKLRAEARNFFNRETLPGISDDLRLVPSSRLKRVQDKIADFNLRDGQLLSDLRVNYDVHVEKDRAALGDRFDPDLYPPLEVLGSYFSITLTTCDLPSGDFNRVIGLDEEAKERMKKEHEAMLVQVGVNARNDVMKTMTQLIQTLADKLSNPDAKVFHESTIENLKEYLDKVPDLNITNDPVLEELRKVASTKLNYTMGELKKSAILKERAAQDAKAILANFGAMGSGRKIIAA